MKALFKIISILLLTFFITFFIDSNRLNVIVKEVIFSASSIMVGLAIALVGISMNNINSLYLSLLDVFNKVESLNEEEKWAIINKLNKIKKELKDNIIFTILAFIAILVLFFLKETNFPFIRWPIEDSFLSKEYTYNVLIITFNFAIILAVYDTIIGSFRLSDALKITK